MKKLILLSILFIIGCNNSTEPEDCAGVAGGTAVEDCAGVCGGDTTQEVCDDGNDQNEGGSIIGTWLIDKQYINGQTGSVWNSSSKWSFDSSNNWTISMPDDDGSLFTNQIHTFTDINGTYEINENTLTVTMPPNIENEKSRNGNYSIDNNKLTFEYENTQGSISLEFERE